MDKIPEKVAAGLQRYTAAIAIMKDVHAWGKDVQGRYFDFETVYHPHIDRFVVVGTLHNPQDVRVPTIVFGLESDVGATPEDGFMVAGTLTDPAEPILSRIVDVNTYGWALNATSETVAAGMMIFIEKYMFDHPGFQRIVQAAAADVISAIPPKRPTFSKP